MPLNKDELQKFKRIHDPSNTSMAAQFKAASTTVNDYPAVYSEQDIADRNNAEIIEFYFQLLKKNNFDRDQAIAYIGRAPIIECALEVLKKFLDVMQINRYFPEVYFHKSDSGHCCSIIYAKKPQGQDLELDFIYINSLVKSFNKCFDINTLTTVNIPEETVTALVCDYNENPDNGEAIIDFAKNLYVKKISFDELRDFFYQQAESILRDIQDYMTDQIKNIMDSIVYYHQEKKLPLQEIIQLLSKPNEEFAEAEEPYIEELEHTADTQTPRLDIEHYIENLSNKRTKKLKSKL